MRRAIYEDDVIKLLDKGWKLGVYPVASNIHALPPAESEIIRCKDCYHYPSKYADCPMIGWARNENDFCSKAERKDDD